MLKNKNKVGRARVFLLLDALAPVVGALLTLLVGIPEWAMALYLGFFAGFLLYIGLGDILPSAHRDGSSYVTIGLTALGAGLAFMLTMVLEF